MQYNLHFRCFYDCFYEPMKIHSHSADLMERKRRKTVRGRGRKNKREG